LSEALDRPRFVTLKLLTVLDRSRRLVSRQMRLDGAPEQRGAHAPFEPLYDPSLLDQHERGHGLDPKRPARSGRSSTSTCSTRRYLRSFQAMLATRLSIRRAGPEFTEKKKMSSGDPFTFKAIKPDL